MEGRRHELEVLLQLQRPQRRAAFRRPFRAQARARARVHALHTWAKLLVVLSCTILVAFVSASDLVDYDGRVIPFALFHRRRQFFYWLLVLVVITFYTTVIGAVFSPSHPRLAEALLALVSLLLAFTILAWVFLPYTLSLAPWCFFLLTLLALLAVIVNECCLQ